jgi:drug/metabolite transporter (DMT)-like permease
LTTLDDRIDATQQERPGLHATPLGLAAVAIPVFGWSVANTIVKLTDIPVVEFIFYRLWLGSACMIIVLLAARRRITWQVVKRSAPAGVLFALNLVLFFEAIRRTGVADVLLIAALQPALVLVVAGRWFGEHPSRKDLTWALVSVGCVALSILGSSENAVWSLQGDILAVGALFVFTAYFLLSKRVRQDVQAIEFMTTVTLVAAIIMTPVAVATGDGFGGFEGNDWLLLALFVLTAQAGHLMVAWAHSQVDVTVSSLLVLAEPVLSAIAALILLGEPMTVLQVAGGLLALGAVGSIVWRATRSSPEAEVVPVEVAPE